MLHNQQGPTSVAATWQATLKCMLCLCATHTRHLLLLLLLLVYATTAAPASL
jgi:hypothetical protein